jgi:hypothetical protein
MTWEASMAKPKINFSDISSGDEDALSTFTSGETLLNFGNLTTTGDLANGIFAGADDVTIRHFGNIETSGLGAAGIYVQGDNARIENFGSIKTTGTFTSDELFFSEGIFAEGNNYYIVNHGSIRVEGLGSSALVGFGPEEGGVIINFGVLDSSATSSIVIAAFGDRSQVINAGQVTCSGGDAAAVRVLGEDASAHNRGEILITGADSVGLQGVIANTHLTNQGVISVTADVSWGMLGGGNGHQATNLGLIETQGTFAAGIVMVGRGGPLDEPGLNFEVVNAGRITTDGDLAIGVALGFGGDGFNRAVDGQIVNSGVIETSGDGAAGVVMIGDGHHLTNSGRITTDGGAFFGDPVGELRAAGVVVSGDDALVENARTGVIESLNADSAAVELNVLDRDGLSNADTSSTLENFGRIEGTVAVLGGAGEETVINHGCIVGDVNLGTGDDTFVFAKGGALNGDLILGGGDDVVVIENGSGTSTIADFAGAGVADGDRIDVSVFFSTINELKAESVQSGTDVVVALDQNDTLVIENVQLSTLNSSDFIFVL